MIRALLAALAVLTAASAMAQTAVQNPHTRVELLAESTTPAPGKPVTVGIRLTPQPGWHTYWLNPGDAGLAPRAKWSFPASTLRFPVPGRFLVSGLMNYVYEAPNVLLAEVTMPAAAPGARLPLTATLDYLICTHELCVPERATVALPLTIGDGATDPGQAATFAAARAALPRPVDWPAHYSVAGGRFVLGVPFGSAAKVADAYFYPLADGSIDYATPQVVTVAGDQLRIETKAGGRPTGPVAGVLKVNQAGDAAPLGFALTATPGPVPAAGIAAGAKPAAGWGVFLPALLLAVAGGVILNVMPCVFPILSLKALSLAKGGASPAAARRDALAYSAGIILVCVALGGLILALRAAGTQVGWAFQLQDPRVILALLLLMTAIALNLAGLFEITLGSGNAGQSLVAKGGAAGSFWTGALAAFVATPCTGPFMAGALGAALVLPPVAGLLVFAGLGLGLALPFLAIGFVPALRRRLPRPGAWMAVFRRILSVPMFATALALAWVLGKQAGVAGMTMGLAAALLTGLALWWFGLRQTRGAERGNWLPLGVAVAAGIAAVAFVPTATPAVATTVDAPAGLAAQAFSPAKLAALQAAKTPTLLYFTADWCLTCKVNERGALSSAAVAAAFAKAGIVTLVGDWTGGDATIGAFLEAHGRAGVPLYLFYHADGRIEELPQILTVDRLVAIAG